MYGGGRGADLPVHRFKAPAGNCRRTHRKTALCLQGHAIDREGQIETTKDAGRVNLASPKRNTMFGYGFPEVCIAELGLGDERFQ